MNDNYKTANLISKLRKDLNMTQEQLAKMVGVKKESVCHWESDEGIKTENLYMLSKIFNISLKELIDGKLDNEDPKAVWLRNYDLEEYNFDKINKSNIDRVLLYFRRINNIIDKFYGYLKTFAFDKLNEHQLEEFTYLRQLFNFDYGYYDLIQENEDGLEKRQLVIGERYQQNIEKNLIKHIINNHNLKDEDHLRWEYSKIYQFKNNDKAKIVFESNSQKALQAYLSTLNRVEKDSLLTGNIYRENKNLTDDQIENTPFIKTMVNNGCQIAYNYETVFKPHLENFEEEDLDKFEGKIIKEELLGLSVEDINLFTGFDGHSRYSAFNNWKAMTLEEYLKLIDINRTKRVSNIVNLKDEHPMEYYQTLGLK